MQAPLDDGSEAIVKYLDITFTFVIYLGMEEDAIGEMDYFAADGDEDDDLYSEDDCNLDDQQEMEVNDSNTEVEARLAVVEEEDVVLTPCPSE